MHSCTKIWYGILIYLAWYVPQRKRKEKRETILVTAVPLNRIPLVTPRVKKKKVRERKKGK